MLAMMFAVHLLMVCRVRNFWEMIAVWPDNPSYLDIATVIGNGHYSGGEMPQHFWGFPYAIALLSKLLPIPPLMALVLISILASLAVSVLVHRLLGGWVAAVFILINYEWITLSVQGGAEPLFMCLLYASFLAVRYNRWNLGTLLAALSTTVRPLGVFALLCFAIVLARRKSYRQLAVITLIGVAIGVLYVVPIWRILGSPFANFTGYQSDWGPHEWPLTYPFGALVPAYLTAIFAGTRWYTLLFLATWPVLALAGTIRIWLPNHRPDFLEIYQPEAYFVTIYALFFLSYNYVGIAWYFSRFIIPIVPLLVFSLRNWIPRDRRLLWAAAGLSALLSAAEQVGFKNVFGFRLP
jgi:xanthosine utilization system XapX-like protein